MKRFLGLMFALGCIVATNKAFADQVAATDWLLQQQDTVGAIHLESGIANIDQSTQESALVFAKSDRFDLVSHAAEASSFLDSQGLTDSSTESISRRILLKASAGLTLDQDVQQLLSRRNSSGGYGDYLISSPNSLSTSFALAALHSAGLPADSATINYLVTQQNADGSWSFPQFGESNTQLTAYALDALWRYRNSVNVSQALAAAKTHLESQRGATSSLWNSTEASALALISLVQQVTDRTVLQSSVDALIGQQLENGSFNNDVYLTALIARLMQVYAQPSGDAIVLSGRIIDADSGFPLTGVDVRLSGASIAQITSNSSGQFSIEATSPGSHSLAFSLNGYGDAVLQTFLVVGEQLTLNDIVLSKLATDPVTGEPVTSGSVRGTVSASVDNQPLPGVLVTVNGSTALSTTSDANGSYLIPNVPAGPTAITVAADGYTPQTAVADLAATQTLLFSPKLTPTPPSTINIFGRVTDAVSGAPLDGVSIALSPQAQNSTTTDADGNYLIEDLNNEPLQISTILVGYQVVSGSIDVPNGSNVDFSPALSLEGSQPVPSVGALDARLVDRISGQALGGVTVTLTYTSSGDTHSFTTDADGFFTTTDLSAGSATLEFSLLGYITEIFNVDIQSSIHLNLGFISLAPENNNPTANVTGVVVNSTTNEPLAGVAINVDGVTSILTDQTGGFELLDVSAGELNLTFIKAGFNLTELSFVVDAGRDLDLAQIRLRPETIEVLQPDLQIVNFSRNDLSSNLATGEINGQLSVVVTNLGTQNVDAAFDLTAFSDVNGNDQFDENVDITLGQSVLTSGLAVSDTSNILLPISGVLNFRDAPIHVMVDSNSVVVELNELNNVLSTTDECKASSSCQGALETTIEPELKWAWSDEKVMTSPVVGPFIDTNGDGEIDTNDTPMVIVGSHTGFVDSASAKITVINGITGETELVIDDSNLLTRASAHPALGDIDADGRPEVVFYSNRGNKVVAVDNQGQFKWESDVGATVSTSFNYGAISLADIDGDGLSEVIARDYVFNHDGTLKFKLQTNFAIDHAMYSTVADIDLDGTLEIVFGGQVYTNLGRPFLQSQSSVTVGFHALGNFDDDEYPEIVVSNIFNTLYLLDDDGQVLWETSIPRSGAPVIADFDGDGDPEIGVATSGSYRVYKKDGTLLWSTVTRDRSGVTGSTAFDFNNDGKHEIAYAAENGTFIFDGATGEALATIPRGSATATEAPVVADVDGNGSAEILFVSDRAGSDGYPVGLIVLKNKGADWAATRNIWNQHAYSIDNVNDDGSIPANPVKGWLTHNTFRLNAFPQCSEADPVVKWDWIPEDGVREDVFGPVSVGQLNDDNGDGQINELDKSDVVFISRRPSVSLSGILNAVNGVDGSKLWRKISFNVNDAGSTAIADIDGDGIVEIVVASRLRDKLLAFEHDGQLKWESPTGPPAIHTNPSRDGITIADLDQDGVPEIVHGRRVYRADGSLHWVGAGGQGDNVGYGSLPIVADIDLDGSPDVLGGRTVYESDGTIKWSRSEISTAGFTGIGDFDEDDFAEVVLVALGKVYLLEHDGAIKWGPVALPGGGVGGPPIIADLDGDGQPEIGVAGAKNYVTFETDGSIKWLSQTQDDSSSRTGSSVFDFDDDGDVEVLYSDEEFFRMYEGSTGRILFQRVNVSGTSLEYPVVVDVDQDNHADILVGSVAYNRATNVASPGLRAFEAADNSWANTRRIWNQHSYHINNINDDGTVPTNEEPSWLTHNTYRLNTFLDRDPSAVSDLTISQLQVLEAQNSVTARFGNGGGVSSPAGFTANLYHHPLTGGNRILLGTITLPAIASGEYVDLQWNNISGLVVGDSLQGVVDPQNQLDECLEDNNSMRIQLAGLLGDIEETLDKQQYANNENVEITRLVSNIGTIEANYQVTTLIEDTAGNQLASLGIAAVNDVPASQNSTSMVNWNTGLTLSGDYIAKSILYDSEGNLLDEAVQTFQIISSAEPVVTLRTVTDRTQYHVNDSVEIDDLVQNLSLNSIVPGASLRVTVQAPNGAVIFSDMLIIGDLSPNFSNSYTDLLGLTAAAVGGYQVFGEVVSSSGFVLATDQSSFTVVDDLTQSLSGTVQVSHAVRFIGQSLSCADSITHTGTTALTDLSVRQVLINVDAVEVIISTEQMMDITPASTLVLPNRDIATAQMEIGNYACALQVLVDNQWLNLDNDFFELLVPPIKIELGSAAGDKGRLLILLDDERTYSTNGNEPELATQRAYLENLLTQAGWRYTIVESGEAFVRGLQTGAYINYLLLSEAEKISEQGQKELREAIFRGEGLVEAGSHDQRQGRIDDALGVKFKGKSNQIHGLSLFDSEIASADSLALSIPDTVLTAELQGANKIAEFIPDLAKGNRPAAPAISEFAYGDGQSIYFGIDVLAEATLLNSVDNVFAQLILNALTLVNNADQLQQSGVSLPLHFTVFNEQQATPARLVVALPVGTSLVEVGDGTFEEQSGITSITWLLDFAEGETVIKTIWVSRPAVDSSVSATVESGTDSDWLLQAETDLLILAGASTTIAEVLSSIPPDKKWKPIRQALSRAEGYLTQGNYPSALRELLKAADFLARGGLVGADAVRKSVASVIRATEQGVVNQ